MSALGTYLNDHMAGSSGAISMLEHAVEDHAGTPLGAGLADLLAEVREDQRELKALIQRIGSSESSIKKAGAWLGEKVTRMKLGGTGTEKALARLEMLETLSMGIHGKLALWKALRRAAPYHAQLRELDLARLEHRAREQHDRVDAWRLEAAEEAFR